MLTPPCSPKTILVVDDEPTLRRLSRRILERGGFLVLDAADGTEALAAATAASCPVALVLADLSLPGCDGREVVAKLRGIWPNLPAILTSGHGSGVLAASVEGAGPGTVFLAKPFTAAVLLDRVNSVLAGEKGAGAVSGEASGEVAGAALTQNAGG